MTHGARKPRRPRWGLTGDTMALAIHGAAKPERADVDQVIATIQAAHKALREGVATELQWSVLAGSLDTARMIEKQGVVRGIHEHIASAHHALQSVYTRAMQANPPRLAPHRPALARAGRHRHLCGSTLLPGAPAQPQRVFERHHRRRGLRARAWQCGGVDE